MRSKLSLKIYLDESPRQYFSGWIHLKDHKAFKSLLDTVNLSEIECISFGDELEEDEEEAKYSPFSAMTSHDCAVTLIQHARANKLPVCYTHGKRNSNQIMNTINHYNNSYKYDNLCSKLVIPN